MSSSTRSTKKNAPSHDKNVQKNEEEVIDLVIDSDDEDFRETLRSPTKTQQRETVPTAREAERERDAAVMKSTTASVVSTVTPINKPSRPSLTNNASLPQRGEEQQVAAKNTSSEVALIETSTTKEVLATSTEEVTTSEEVSDVSSEELQRVFRSATTTLRSVSAPESEKERLCEFLLTHLTHFAKTTQADETKDCVCVLCEICVAALDVMSGSNKPTYPLNLLTLLESLLPYTVKANPNEENEVFTAVRFELVLQAFDLPRLPSNQALRPLAFALNAYIQLFEQQQPLLYAELSQTKLFLQRWTAALAVVVLKGSEPPEDFPLTARALLSLGAMSNTFRLSLMRAAPQLLAALSRCLSLTSLIGAKDSERHAVCENSEWCVDFVLPQGVEKLVRLVCVLCEDAVTGAAALQNEYIQRLILIFLCRSLSTPSHNHEPASQQSFEVERLVWDTLCGGVMSDNAPVRHAVLTLTLTLLTQYNQHATPSTDITKYITANRLKRIWKLLEDAKKRETDAALTAAPLAAFRDLFMGLFTIVRNTREDKLLNVKVFDSAPLRLIWEGSEKDNITIVWGFAVMTFLGGGLLGICWSALCGEASVLFAHTRVASERATERGTETESVGEREDALTALSHKTAEILQVVLRVCAALLRPPANVEIPPTAFTHTTLSLITQTIEFCLLPCNAKKFQEHEKPSGPVADLERAAWETLRRVAAMDVRRTEFRRHAGFLSCIAKYFQDTSLNVFSLLSVLTCVESFLPTSEVFLRSFFTTEVEKLKLNEVFSLECVVRALVAQLSRLNALSVSLSPQDGTTSTSSEEALSVVRLSQRVILTTLSQWSGKSALCGALSTPQCVHTLVHSLCCVESDVACVAALNALSQIALAAPDVRALDIWESGERALLPLALLFQNCVTALNTSSGVAEMMMERYTPSVAQRNATEGVLHLLVALLQLLSSLATLRRNALSLALFSLPPGTSTTSAENKSVSGSKSGTSSAELVPVFVRLCRGLVNGPNGSLYNAFSGALLSLTHSAHVTTAALCLRCVSLSLEVLHCVRAAVGTGCVYALRGSAGEVKERLWLCDTLQSTTELAGNIAKAVTAATTLEEKKKKYNFSHKPAFIRVMRQTGDCVWQALRLMYQGLVLSGQPAESLQPNFSERAVELLKSVAELGLQLDPVSCLYVAFSLSMCSTSGWATRLSVHASPALSTAVALSLRTPSEGSAKVGDSSIGSGGDPLELNTARHKTLFLCLSPALSPSPSNGGEPSPSLSLSASEFLSIFALSRLVHSETLARAEIVWPAHALSLCGAHARRCVSALSDTMLSEVLYATLCVRLTASERQRGKTVVSLNARSALLDLFSTAVFDAKHDDKEERNKLVQKLALRNFQHAAVNLLCEDAACGALTVAQRITLTALLCAVLFYTKHDKTTVQKAKAVLSDIATKRCVDAVCATDKPDTSSSSSAMRLSRSSTEAALLVVSVVWSGCEQATRWLAAQSASISVWRSLCDLLARSVYELPFKESESTLSPNKLPLVMLLTTLQRVCESAKLVCVWLCGETPLLSVLCALVVKDHSSLTQNSSSEMQGSTTTTSSEVLFHTLSLLCECVKSVSVLSLSSQRDLLSDTALDALTQLATLSTTESETEREREPLVVTARCVMLHLAPLLPPKFTAILAKSVRVSVTTPLCETVSLSVAQRESEKETEKDNLQDTHEDEVVDMYFQEEEPPTQPAHTTTTHVTTQPAHTKPHVPTQRAHTTQVPTPRVNVRPTPATQLPHATSAQLPHTTPTQTARVKAKTGLKTTQPAHTTKQSSHTTPSHNARPSPTQPAPPTTSHNLTTQAPTQSVPPSTQPAHTTHTQPLLSLSHTPVFQMPIDLTHTPPPTQPVHHTEPSHNTPAHTIAVPQTTLSQLPHTTPSQLPHTIPSQLPHTTPSQLPHTPHTQLSHTTETLSHNTPSAVEPHNKRERGSDAQRELEKIRCANATFKLLCDEMYGPNGSIPNGSPVFVPTAGTGNEPLRALCGEIGLTDAELLEFLEPEEVQRISALMKPLPQRKFLRLWKEYSAYLLEQGS